MPGIAEFVDSLGGDEIGGVDPAESIDTSGATVIANGGKPATQTQQQSAIDADDFLSFPDDEEGDGAETNVDGEGDQPESFTNLNPDQLPEEVKPFYKNMLADYTRKMQELGKQRTEFEQNAQAYQSPFIQSAFQLQQLSQQNPAQFVQTITAYAEQVKQAAIQQGIIQPQYEQQAAAELPEGFDLEDLTPTEQFLYNKLSEVGTALKENQQRLQAYEPVVDESRKAAGEAKLNTAFTNIEGELRIRLSEKQKSEISNLALQIGIKDVPKHQQADFLKTVAQSWVFQKQRTNRSASTQVGEKRTMGANSGAMPGMNPNNGASANGRQKRLSIEELVEQSIISG